MVLAYSRDYRRATVRILQPVLDDRSGMMRVEKKDYRDDRGESHAR